MPIKVTCTNCGGVLHAPDDAGGKRGRCPTCGNVLPIPAEAPRASAPAPSPAIPEAPKAAGTRPPSFGDFALGAAPAARASAPGLASTTTEPRKASIGANDAPAARDPFARPATIPPAQANAEVTPGMIKNWKRAKRGMFLVQFAIVLLSLAFLVPNVLRIVAAVMKQDLAIPYKFPGYFGLPWLSSIQETELVAIGVPIALGLIFLLFGRLGVSNAPRRSHARGIGKFAALGSLVAIMGGIALLVPPIAMIVTNENNATIPIISKMQNQAYPEWQLFPHSYRDMESGSYEGIIQLLGIMLAFSALVVSEIWFLSAMGRIGTALDCEKTTGRTSRVTFFLTLTFGLLILIGAIKPDWLFKPEVRETAGDAGHFVEKLWMAKVQPSLNDLGEIRKAIMPAVVSLFVLLIAFGYISMLSAGRNAIGQWLERYHA